MQRKDNHSVNYFSEKVFQGNSLTTVAIAFRLSDW
jgi:hypothetical protein